MISKITVFSVVAFLCCLLACKKKSDGDSSGNESDNTNALLLANATAAESLELVSTAIQTFDDAVEEASGSLAIEPEGLSLSEEELVPGSKWCSNKAEPLFEASSDFASLAGDDIEIGNLGLLSATSKAWAARKFHCLMKVDTGSAESLRGMMAFPKGIVCAAENAGALDWENPGSRDASIEIATDCFSEEFVKNNQEEGKTKIEATITSEILEGEGWDRKLVISDIDLMPNHEMTLKFKNSSDYMAIVFNMANADNSHKLEAWTFTLTSSGELTVETKTYRLTDPEDSSSGNTVMRLLAKGKLDVSEKSGKKIAKYSDFNSFQGIYASFYIHPDDSEKYAGKIATISGTVDDGFLTKTYVCNQEASVLSCDVAAGIGTFYDPFQGEDNCVPSDKKCKGLDAIEFGKDLSLIMIVGDVDELGDKNPEAWYKSLESPLLLDEVTTDFSQVQLK
jgi:hypothetical protein